MLDDEYKAIKKSYAYLLILHIYYAASLQYE
jgi:hypothetical protein